MLFKSLQVLTIIYFLAVAGLMIYGLHRLWLLVCWYLVRRNPAVLPPYHSLIEDPPKVTVQLPLYNERFVAARLIDAVANMNWPRNRLEIQVLDDSIDDTSKIVDERVAYWYKEGVFIKVVRRRHRHGFKAGALAQGITKAWR